MKIANAVIFALLIFFPLMASAAETTEQESAQCKSFYDEHYKEAQKLQQKYPTDTLTEEWKNDEQKRDFTAIIHHSLALADSAEKCGSYDSRFYESQRILCLGYLQGSAEWRKFWGLRQKPFPYCEASLARGDFIILHGLMEFYMKNPAIPHDYQKPLEYINRFAASKHPNSDFALLIAANIYKKGGYGVEKDEKKAFEIIKSLAEIDSKPQFTCELSLYYKNGIGTTKNETEAQKWLDVFKKNIPRKECKFANTEFLFGRSPLEKTSSEKE